MSKKIVALFSGQGAQKVGMGKDLVEEYPLAREWFERADGALGFPLTASMFDGPMEELTRTSRCQPALYLHGLVSLELLKRELAGLEVVAAAGLSLGEFTAHAAAGTFDFETGLKLVARRGLFMEEACEESDGSMAAMIGGDEEAVRKLAADCEVDVANLNSPGQIVLSGSVEGIARAVAEAKGSGIRIAKQLPVAGAYHSRLMKPAQEKLAVELAAADLSPPGISVVSNVTARPAKSAGEVCSTLESQVTGSVRWSESMDYLLDQGHETFVEFGPGGVLKGLMNRIRKGTPVHVVEDVASLAATVEALS